MGQNFIGCDRDQSFLLPPDVREWLPGLFDLSEFPSRGEMATVIADAVYEYELPREYDAVRLWLEDGATISPTEVRLLARCIYDVRKRRMPDTAALGFLDIYDNVEYFLTHLPPTENRPVTGYAAARREREQAARIAADGHASPAPALTPEWQRLHEGSTPGDDEIARERREDRLRYLIEHNGTG